jgi:Arc/MetJ family transcription regulator
MLRRTTIEIDEELLERAKRALGQETMRGTVEEALRRAVETDERDRADRSARQQEFFRKLPDWADLEVLASDEMWR